MSKPKFSYSAIDKERNNTVYNIFMSLGVDDGWEQKDKLENFDLLLKIAEHAKSSWIGAATLDVGCGTGDLISFLRDYQVGEYLGVDIFEKAILKAQEKYPNERFIVGDFLDLSLPFFDFVVCSGALSTNLNSNNYDILEAWIKKMWALSEKGVYFNLLLEETTRAHSNTLFFYNHNKVIQICAKLKDALISTTTTDAGSGDELRELHVYLYRQ